MPAVGRVGGARVVGTRGKARERWRAVAAGSGEDLHLGSHRHRVGEARRRILSRVRLQRMQGVLG